MSSYFLGRNNIVRNMEYLQRIIIVSLIMLTIIGVTFYVFDKKKEYGDHFSLFKIECNNDNV